MDRTEPRHGRRVAADEALRLPALPAPTFEQDSEAQAEGAAPASGFADGAASHAASQSMSKVKKAGPTAEFLISLAIKMKATAAKNRMYTPLFNVLLKKFKNTVGGRLKA